MPPAVPSTLHAWRAWWAYSCCLDVWDQQRIREAEWSVALAGDGGATIGHPGTFDPRMRAILQDAGYALREARLHLPPYAEQTYLIARDVRRVRRAPAPVEPMRREAPVPTAIPTPAPPWARSAPSTPYPRGGPQPSPSATSAPRRASGHRPIPTPPTPRVPGRPAPAAKKVPVAPTRAAPSAPSAGVAPRPGRCAPATSRPAGSAVDPAAAVCAAMLAAAARAEPSAPPASAEPSAPPAPAHGWAIGADGPQPLPAELADLRFLSGIGPAAAWTPLGSALRAPLVQQMV